MTDDTLNGWKEIAAYVGKSVRSAQRWERELGLPTHRIMTPDGQIVYARRSEIDAWRLGMDRKPGGRAAMAAAEEPAAEVPPSSAVTPPAPGRSSRFGIGLWLGMLAASAIIVWGLSLVLPPRAAAGPSTLQLVGRTLEARDAFGRLMWSYRFTEDVHPLTERQVASLSTVMASVAQGDLDGDGHLDHLIAVRFGPMPEETTTSSDAVLAFSHDGRLLWRLQSERTITCGAESYAGPWKIGGVLVSRASSPARVWVAYKHHTWWPSFVVEVLRDGTPVTRYVQSGWIMALTEWKTPSGTWGVAGGVLNELAGASVVLFDLNGAETSLPASDPRFACVTATTTRPERAVVFPNVEVARAGGNAYVIVNRLGFVGTDLRLDVDDSAITGLVGVDGIVRSLEFTDRYWFLHQELEEKQRISHAAADCPERAQPKDVRYWTAAEGWQTRPVQIKSR